MKYRQTGFTTATMALLGFTIVLGIWFFANNDMDAAFSDLRSIIDQFISFFKK